MLHEFELLRAVAPRHEITLLSTFRIVRPEAVRAVQALGVRVEVVPWQWQHGEVRRSRITKLARLILGAGPTLVVANRSERLKPLAEAIIAAESAHPVDVVQIFLGDLAPIADSARAPTALLLFDVYWRLADLVLNGSRPTVQSIRRRLERRNARRWEEKWYARANGVACVSRIDAELVSAMLSRPVDYIPNPVPDEFFVPPEGRRSDTTVTFVGSFGWEPNVDSVRWLCAEIWPQILSRRPDARLRVVGRFAFPELQREVEAVGGEFFVDVDDIRPFYWEAAVVIAPIRMGSGTRNKVLHAMACRAPVVATSSALEGIPAVSGGHLLVADDAAGLADAVVAVLNDPAAASARAESAREIPAGYSSAAAGAQLERWWKDTVATRPAASASARDVRPAAPPIAASVVVCTRERPELLKKSLMSIATAVANVPGTQLIVVEQGERSAAAVCSGVGVDATIVSDQGVGASRARNEGLRHARGDVVLYTDDDCEVPADWIFRHMGTFSDPDVIASFGPVTGIRHVEEYDPVALPARHRRGSPPWFVGHSSNMAVRKSALAGVGGFDERMGPGAVGVTTAEDADLIVRLLRTRSVVMSGTGDAVRHIDWRSSSESRTNLIAYEHGAGAWIGKAFREEPRAALSFLRARVELQKATVEYAKVSGDGSIPRSAFAGAFIRGLIAGMRLKPWQGRGGGRTGPGAAGPRQAENVREEADS